MISTSLRLGFVLVAGFAATSFASADQDQRLADLTTVAGINGLVNGPKLTQGMDTLAKLRMAQEEVANDREVSALLSRSPLHSVVVHLRVEDNGLETTKFQHFYEGLEVVGSRTMHHVGAAGSEVMNQLAKFDVSTRPTLARDTAVSIARSFVSNRDLRGEPALRVLPSDEQDSARLVYWVAFKSQEDLAGRQVVVDAHSGAVIADLSDHHELAPVQVYATRYQGRRLPGCQTLDSDGSPTDFNLRSCAQVVVNSVPVRGLNDQAALRALSNSNKVLSYFQTAHGRNGIDGRGARILNLVHVGERFANAFWDTENSLMGYGDGDGVVMGDMTAAIDVAAHEISHGVTANTAALLSMNESGALNEANSDFFGKLVANDGDWSMGRAIFIRPRAGKDAIRDLANPARLTGVASYQNGQQQSRPYPAHVSQQARMTDGCDGSNDRCNVHYNSTIPGHAMYLMAQAIGKDAAGKLQYATLTHAMTERTGFRQYGAAVRSVCRQILDARSCQAVNGALARVGL